MSTFSSRLHAIGLERLIVGFLLGGLLFLLCDVRFEHREALGETRRSWIPLVYASGTFLAGGVALLRWNEGGREVLGALFGIGVVVGLLGFWFHADGHIVAALRNVLGAWLIPIGQDGGTKIGSIPPPLAPMAFCGLGTLGLLTCAAPATKT